jgi:hypothetical protein
MTRTRSFTENSRHQIERTSFVGTPALWTFLETGKLVQRYEESFRR